MKLLETYRSSSLADRCLLSFQELRTLALHVCSDETTLCLALLQLQRDKQVTVTLHEGEKVGGWLAGSQDSDDSEDLCSIYSSGVIDSEMCDATDKMETYNACT